MKWVLDKQNKVPYYLQLRDLIKQQIIAGDIKDNEHLPGVNVLAAQLEINFDTVRRAYKELEKEGFVTIEKGKGTVVRRLQERPDEPCSTISAESQAHAAAKALAKKVLADVKDPEAAKKIMNRAFDEAVREIDQRHLVYIDYASPQMADVAHRLAEFFHMRVRSVAIDRLKDEIPDLTREKSGLAGIITTAFCLNDVRAALHDLPVEIHVVITSISHETRKAIENFDRNTRVGFICRDEEVLSLFSQQVKAELADKARFIGCSFEEGSKVKKILKSVDVVLVSPRVFNDVRIMAPPHLKVINIFDHIDPMSLKMIKDKITGPA